MLPERLKEIYKSPKSTLVGVLAGIAGVMVVVVHGIDGGLESYDPGELLATGSLLVGMVVGFFKKD